MDKFQNKYRIASARLQSWDYRWAGAYFITICTQNREHYFGENSVETGHTLSLQTTQTTEQSKTIGQQGFQNIGKNSVSSIIGSYKWAVSKHTYKLGFNFEWQSLFFDHIIGTDDEYQRITNCIKTNPENWETDKFFKSEEL